MCSDWSHVKTQVTTAGRRGGAFFPVEQARNEIIKFKIGGPRGDSLSIVFTENIKDGGCFPKGKKTLKSIIYNAAARDQG